MSTFNFYYQENELVYAKADINTLKNKVYERLGYARD